MEILLPVLVLIALALAFDFINGFHDAANSVATIPAAGIVAASLFVFFHLLF